jgi:hypothetical protein
MMEAVCTSETLVNLNLTTRRNIPEDSKLHTRCHDNLKSRISSHDVMGQIHPILPLAETCYVTCFSLLAFKGEIHGTIQVSNFAAQDLLVCTIK